MRLLVIFILNPYLKVKGCLSVYLSMAKDLANHRTDMFLLSQCSFSWVLERFITIRGGGYHQLTDHKHFFITLLTDVFYSAKKCHTGLPIVSN